MNSQEFEELWGMAEAREQGKLLAAEYPSWRSRRRRTVGLTMAALVIVAIATPMILPQHKESDYLKVYCNNHTSTDRQWVDLAGEMLLSSQS